MSNNVNLALWDLAGAMKQDEQYLNSIPIKFDQEVDSNNNKGSLSYDALQEQGESTQRSTKTEEEDSRECQWRTLKGKQVVRRKRRGSSETHNMAERRRRDKIAKKMKDLQALIPNSHKTDKVSILDDAIRYLQALKTQVEILSIARGTVWPSMLMPPTALQHPHQFLITKPDLAMPNPPSPYPPQLSPILPENGYFSMLQPPITSLPPLPSQILHQLPSLAGRYSSDAESNLADSPQFRI